MSAAAPLTLTTTSATASAAAEFWRVAKVWQSLCETVREGKQLALVADRNELLVAAAIRKGGGPLKLPVHVEDVDPMDRMRVQALELRAQERWFDMSWTRVSIFRYCRHC